MDATLLRQVAKTFGWLTETLPEAYRPAAEAFLHSIVNDQPDSEREVPQAILGTIALSVLRAIFDNQFPPELDYEAAVVELDYHSQPVLVQWNNYPRYRGRTIEGYGMAHPHYFVLGGFTTVPIGGGHWLIQDRYDWHNTDNWRVPSKIGRKVPKWLLRQFCFRNDEASDIWYIKEVGTLDKWTVPYWHRSIVRLADYLNPQDFE